ncbi:hypothetical protein ACP4J4_05360 [Aureimonas ureilytica]|uniref:hypothetical protein n=1 Tax=Aureimonas ureilytica TaxID=401562 RepID=UPI003CFB3F81
MPTATAQTAAAPDTPAAVDALAASAPQSVDQAMRVDPAFVLSKIETWVVGFQRLLLNIVVALVLFAIAAGIAWGVERSFRAWANKHERSNLGAVLGSFVKWVILLVGIPRAQREGWPRRPDGTPPRPAGRISRAEDAGIPSDTPPSTRRAEDAFAR